MPEKPQVSPPPAHYRLRLEETPTTTRFLLSNGVSLDVESYATHSGMRTRIVDWAKKQFGDKDIRIEGATELVDGELGLAVTLSSWEPPGEPAPKKSSDTSAKRSVTKNDTKRSIRVRPA